jgi:hypothetical protein
MRWAGLVARMSWTRSVWFSLEKAKGTDYLGDVGIDGRKILKWF